MNKLGPSGMVLFNGLITPLEGFTMHIAVAVVGPGRKIATNGKSTVRNIKNGRTFIINSSYCVPAFLPAMMGRIEVVVWVTEAREVKVVRL